MHLRVEGQEQKWHFSDNVQLHCWGCAASIYPGQSRHFWGVKRSLPCLLARPGDRDAGADAARGKAGKVLSGAEIFYARLLPALEARS